MMKYEKIREIICSSHGGMEAAARENAMALWGSLTPREKEQHIQEYKQKGKKNAVSVKSKPDV